MNELEKLERELLEELEEEPESYADTEEFCIIDPEARTITIPPGKRIIGVESDQEAKRLYFKCPKVVGDNIDLSLLSLRINFQNAGNEKNQYLVEDVKTVGDNITFSWKMKRSVTAYKGKIKFILCAVKAEYGTIKNEWNTTLNTECECLEGLEVDQTGVEEETKDIVQQLIELLNTSADKAVQEVEKEKTASIKALEDTKSKAVESIKNEGTTQINAVEAKGAEALESLPEDYLTAWNSKVDKDQSAPPIIQTATGNPIIVQDSAERRVQGLRLFGKTTQVQTTGAQLFKYELSGGSGEIKVSCGEDGVITLNGTCTKNVFITGSIIPTQGSISVAMNNASSNRNVSIKFSDKDSADISTIYPLDSANKKATITLSREAALMIIRIESGTTLSDFTIKPMLYQQGDGTWKPFSEGKPSPSPDYPQELKSAGGDGEIEGVMHGAQLFDASRIPTKSTGGATVKNNGDGSFTVSGSGNLKETFSEYYELSHEETLKLLKVGRVSSANNATYPSVCVYLYYNVGNYYTLVQPGQPETEVTEEMLAQYNARLRFYMYGYIENTIRTGTIKPMIYQNGNGTWEPYKPPQTLTITTPNGLPGIPVESGGNYTDNTGQQWISDVINLKTGKRTQYIEKITLDGTENFTLQGINEYGIANFKLVLLKPGKSEMAISNYFKKQDSAVANTTEEGFTIADNYSLYIRMKQERVNTVEKLKEWLKTHNVTIVYILTKSIETDITQETLTAYKKLHSNYPSTVVQNAEGAGMELEYIADTKTYLDNIKKEFMEAIANTNAQLLQEVTHVRKY